MKTRRFTIHLLPVFYVLAIGLLISLDSSEKIANSSETGVESDGPMEFLRFHQAIRTMEGKEEPDYEANYQWNELRKAQALATQANLLQARTGTSNGVLEWKERGPGNVPGRTRGVIVDPDDPAKRTWYAGSATGGVWKTIDAGNSWQWLTPDISNLATSALAMAENNRNIIYAGSGEGFGLIGGVNGTGIFKSTNRGNTWTLLASTTEFSAINRIIINPADDNNVIVASNLGIYRTVDGGSTWNRVFEGVVQDLRATPGNFQILYGGQNRIGVIKSIDGGITWSQSKVGMNPNGRVEIAVSPVKTDRLFASCQGALSTVNSDLYMSDNAGATWTLIDLKLSNKVLNYLGDQGWYDNTVICDPYDRDKVYIGGIGTYRVQLDNNATGTPITSYTMQQNGTTFITLINATGFNNSNFDVEEAANQTSVEIRFGAGVKQKAHRFLVPDGATSGVADANYSYQDYVDVPFEVWDISSTPNRQLMASFRDQDRNGAFNLYLSNTSGAPTEQSREYIFIHNIAYDAANANSTVAVAGGHMAQPMYNFWPVLSEGSLWTPNALPTSNLRIVFSSINKILSTVVSINDPYSEYDNKNNANFVHPDQHNIVIIKESDVTKTFRILLANDGGLFLSRNSDNPGITQGDWTKVGNGYNTSQFYGVDKKPGADEYIGGMQDNSTYYSPPGVSASATTGYITNNVLGGDGFEAIWNNLDSRKVIGGAQFNNFFRTVDGGNTWTRAVTGLTGAGTSGTHPFVSKLAGSKQSPETVYTLNRDGVWKSSDFGGTWSLTPITQKWGASSTMDIEVSRANANIIWAGNAMSSNQNIHVSTNGGKTFSPTENVFAGRSISKLASHPTEEKTAYALFSQASSPKILRTKDLGQTWEDISGFGTGATSTRGFPNVAVFCLYVRTDDPNIMWAGTELGIVETLDGGLSWKLLDDFPNVSVWDIKGQDDQIVIATHGRGIWTAKVAAVQISKKNPRILAGGTTPRGQVILGIKLEEPFDSTQVWIGTRRVGKLNKVAAGEYTVRISGVAPGRIETRLVGFLGNAPINSEVFVFNHLELRPITEQYFSFFNSANDFITTNLNVSPIGGGLNSALQTIHPYLTNREHVALLRQPIRITDTYPFFFYRDIAIVEPKKDFVVVEATKNGLTWTAIEPAYDASYNAIWTSAYNANQPGTEAMFVDHNVNLKSSFAVGDTLLFRFRKVSDNTVTAWGWAIDDLYIQQKPTGVTKVDQPTLSLFPNPSTGNFTVSVELSGKSDVRVQVLNLTGQALYEKQWINQSGLFKQEINLGDVPTGFYLVSLATRDGKSTTKIKIQR